jgi:hypothetical protein
MFFTFLKHGKQFAYIKKREMQLEHQVRHLTLFTITK